MTLQLAVWIATILSSFKKNPEGIYMSASTDCCNFADAAGILCFSLCLCVCLFVVVFVNYLNLYTDLAG